MRMYATQEISSWESEEKLNCLTFIIDFKAVGTHSEIAGETQGENGACACDWSRHLKSC